jgi:hypothetical protein
VIVSIAYVLFVPGLIRHLLSIGSAVRAANEELHPGNRPPPPRLLRAA